MALIAVYQTSKHCIVESSVHRTLDSPPCPVVPYRHATCAVASILYPQLVETSLSESYIERVRSMLPPEALASNSKYVAKLDFPQRCAALALVLAGVERPIVARAFGVNISTLRHITNPHSPHYKNVRKRHFELGTEKFIAEYINHTHYELIESTVKFMKNTGEDQLSLTRRQELLVMDASKPNPKADSKMGAHDLNFFGMVAPFSLEFIEEPNGEQFTQRLDMRGNVEVLEPGWYFRPLAKNRIDYLKDDKSLYGEQEDRMTSASALAGFKRRYDQSNM